MTDLRQAAQQALEALESLQGGCTDHDDGTVEAITVWCPEVIDALRSALEQQAEPVLQTCNCRWDGDVQVQQCTLHEAHVDAIHEWAERAKVAERKLAQQAEPVMLNGLTETETNATASVMGLTKQAEPVSELQKRYLESEKAFQQQAEPVGEVIDERGEVDYISYVPPVGTALYTTPPQRQWQGLTDEEITELRLKTFDAVATNYENYRAIEAKLKEKNNG